MKKMSLLFVVATSLILSACGGSSSSGGDNADQTPAPREDVNVAASSYGTTAVSTVNVTDTGNLIDEKEGTAWTSNSGTPILITFLAPEKVKKIELSWDGGTRAAAGTNPDILVELSLLSR